MICHKCGTAIAPGAQYCAGCGAKADPERTYIDNLRTNFRRLSWSFGVSLLSIVVFIVLSHEKQFDAVPGLGKITVLVPAISAVAFYTFLGILAAKLKRSPIVWVGATFVFNPIGPFIAYGNMWRLVRAAVKATKSEGNANSR